MRRSSLTTHLLQIEDVMVEIILQLLICIVDTELLEAVGFKVLKPKNVQDTNGQALENKSMDKKQTIIIRKIAILVAFNDVDLCCCVFA